MTETFTNSITSIVKNDFLTDDADDDLDDKEKHIYTLIAAKLNLLQIVPKEETIQKILTYSKQKDNF